MTLASTAASCIGRARSGRLVSRARHLLVFMLALVTLGAPDAVLAQLQQESSNAAQGGQNSSDLQVELKQSNRADHRPSDDFKLGGPDEPDFPPPVARLSRGTLHVQGTQGRDLIEIVLSGQWVEIWISDNANPKAPVEIFFDTYHVNEVEVLRLFGLAGRDVIINETSIPDFIWGGLGNDDILAGDGVSHLFGQDGDDILNGNGGDDFLWGDTGTDYLFGGPGSDLVSGDDGTDWLSGGDSFGQSDDDVDQLVGGAGGDIFTVAPVNVAEDILFDYDPGEGDVLNE